MSRFILFSKTMVDKTLSGDISYDTFDVNRKYGILTNVFYYFQTVVVFIFSIFCYLPIVDQIYEAIATNWGRGIVGFFLRGVYWKSKFGKMGADVFIDRGFTAYPCPNNIEIGSMVHIDVNVTVVCSKNGQLKIGDRVWIGNCSLLDCQPFVEIGSDVSVGVNNVIYGGIAEMLYEGKARPPCSLSRGHYDHLRGVIIKRFVGLGAEVLIAPNPSVRGEDPSKKVFVPVVIGQGSVIGANSMLMDSVGEFEVWVGTPAKKVNSFKAIIDSGGPEFMEYYK